MHLNLIFERTHELTEGRKDKPKTFPKLGALQQYTQSRSKEGITTGLNDWLIYKKLI